MTSNQDHERKQGNQVSVSGADTSEFHQGTQSSGLNKKDTASFAKDRHFQEEREPAEDPSLTGPLILPTDPNSTDTAGRGMLSEVASRLGDLAGQSTDSGGGKSPPGGNCGNNDPPIEEASGEGTRSTGKGDY